MIMVHVGWRWCGAGETTPETAAVWVLTCKFVLATNQCLGLCHSVAVHGAVGDIR